MKKDTFAKLGSVRKIRGKEKRGLRGGKEANDLNGNTIENTVFFSQPCEIQGVHPAP